MSERWVILINLDKLKRTFVRFWLAMIENLEYNYIKGGLRIYVECHEDWNIRL